MPDWGQLMPDKLQGLIDSLSARHSQQMIAQMSMVRQGGVGAFEPGSKLEYIDDETPYEVEDYEAMQRSDILFGSPIGVQVTQGAPVSRPTPAPRGSRRWMEERIWARESVMWHGVPITTIEDLPTETEIRLDLPHGSIPTPPKPVGEIPHSLKLDIYRTFYAVYSPLWEAEVDTQHDMMVPRVSRSENEVHYDFHAQDQVSEQLSKVAESLGALSLTITNDSPRGYVTVSFTLPPGRPDFLKPGDSFALDVPMAPGADVRQMFRCVGVTQKPGGVIEIQGVSMPLRI